MVVGFTMLSLCIILPHLVSGVVCNSCKVKEAVQGNYSKCGSCRTPRRRLRNGMSSTPPKKQRTISSVFESTSEMPNPKMPHAYGAPPSTTLIPTQPQYSIEQPDPTWQIILVSLTISKLKGNVPVTMLDQLRLWLNLVSCVRAVVCLERGDRKKNLHVQGSLEMRMPNTPHGLAELKSHLQDNLPARPCDNYHMMVKFGASMQTFTYLSGYCMKQWQESWFRCCVKGVSEQMALVMRRSYGAIGRKYGAGKILIWKKSVYSAVDHFYNDYLVPLTVSVAQILRFMIVSGLYLPGEAWCHSPTGRGTNETKMTILFEWVKDNSSASIYEVRVFFFDVNAATTTMNGQRVSRRGTGTLAVSTSTALEPKNHTCVSRFGPGEDYIPLGEEIPDPDPDFTIDTGAGELPLDLDTATFSEATEHARHLRSGTAISGMAADGDDCLSNYIPPVATIVKSDGTVDFPQSDIDIDITELQIDNEIPDPLPKPDPEVADPGFEAGASFPEFTEIPDPGYLAAENANDAEVPDNTGASTSAASTFILPGVTHRHTSVDDTDEGSGTSESSSDDDDTVTRRTPINLRSRKKQPEYADDDSDFEDAEIATENDDSDSE